jgi:TetR/AcrR family transcriptional regulator, transcriptional repressor for nem operon
MSPAEGPMRDRIREIATDMLIRDGYQGFRFQDVANALNTTRTNLHYHFGNKETLCEEVIVDYVDRTYSRFESIWHAESTLEDKILGMLEYNRERYLKYNPDGNTAHPWSLIGRMRLERELVGPKAREALLQFSARLEQLVTQGIATAVRRKELRQDAPVEDIALQLVAIANSANPITQDAGSFERLEHLYRAFARIVSHAYGLKKPAGRLRAVRA